MGVRGFYRWLINKYPNIVVNVNENHFEFDHLYLDMNDIIHHCFHPDNTIFPPTTFEEVFENIYLYIDRLFSLVKPRKLLYLAIDGVASRAKLNQQRCRIFRTVIDNQIAEKEEEKLRKKFSRLGKKLPPVLESEVSDPNVIAPGTEFMFELSRAIKSYINKRLRNHPERNEIKIILSDATVPGEGEHKIMSFIRTLRSLPDYDPNTRHCIYGQDADLIMFALATHEIHISIIKENVNTLLAATENPVSESTLLRTIEEAVAATFALDDASHGEKILSIRDKCKSVIIPQHYEFIHVWILREYLELDMEIIDLPDNFVFNFERIVDDFIFICFFMGNDFLPRLPTLEISEDGIGLLMNTYRSEFSNLGGYLVDMQQVNDPHFSFIELERVEKFILAVGNYEEKIFKKRADLRQKLHRSISSESRKDEINEQSSEAEINRCCNSISDIQDMIENAKEFKEELKKSIRESSDILRDWVLRSDKVKLGSEGWKQRYYKEKFSVEGVMETEIIRKEIVQNYTEGLVWSLMFYFSDIPSWNWYYPYHFGLFASELRGLAQVNVIFHKGFPLKPFDQLMAVLPPKSAHALPKAYRDLMISSESEIAEFYPTDCELDIDGRRYLWEGICKVPFIQQDKLLNATCQLEAKIDLNESRRNVATTDHLFWRVSDSCAEFVDYIVQHSEKQDFQNALHEDPIMCCSFKLPVPSLRAPHLLDGVQVPEKTVFKKDISVTPLWHESMTKRPATRWRSKAQHGHWKAAACNGKDGYQSYSNTRPKNPSHNNISYSQSSKDHSEANICRGLAAHYNPNGSFQSLGNARERRLAWSATSNATASYPSVHNDNSSYSTARGRAQTSRYYGDNTDSQSSSQNSNRW